MDISYVTDALERISLVDVLLALSLIVVLYVGSVWFRIRKKHDDKYPPFAPGGMMEHLRIITTTSTYSWWLLVSDNSYTRLGAVVHRNCFISNYTQLIHLCFALLFVGCV